MKCFSFRFSEHLLWFCLLLALFSCVTAQETRHISIAVLDFGGTQTGQRATERVFALLSQEKDFALVDRDLSRAASRGVGYKGSLNLSLEEARDIGAAIGCEFFIIGDAQTIRRSSSNKDYFESYASIFIVSARTGKLLMWQRPMLKADTTEEAEKLLLNELNQLTSRYAEKIRQAQKAEANERTLSVGKSVPVIEEIPQEGTQQAEGFRPPQPFRRIRPAYTEEASIADAEATVDVLVDLDEQGEVMKVAVVRWAGFGLDESVVNSVKQSHFRPAMRDGKAFPIRVLLRYNFRRPPKK
jgi:TonB family protein